MPELRIRGLRPIASRISYPVTSANRALTNWIVPPRSVITTVAGLCSVAWESRPIRSMSIFRWVMSVTMANDPAAFPSSSNSGVPFSRQCAREPSGRRMESSWAPPRPWRRCSTWSRSASEQAGSTNSCRFRPRTCSRSRPRILHIEPFTSSRTASLSMSRKPS